MVLLVIRYAPMRRGGGENMDGGGVDLDGGARAPSIWGDAASIGRRRHRSGDETEWGECDETEIGGGAS